MATARLSWRVSDTPLLTVSERSGFRFSLRKRKATTGMMQMTVVSAMVSHTAGWARVFWALPEGGRGQRPWESQSDSAPFDSWQPHSASPTT